MSRSIDKVLAPLETTDPFLLRALTAMSELLEGTDAAERLGKVRLYVAGYAFAPAAIRKGRYYTDNCAALVDEQAIVVNEVYLLETEAAMRSFDLAGELLAVPYLRSDEDLFGLVQRVRADAAPYVARLRALDALPGREGADAEALDGFAMLLVFLVGHELGHLAQGHDQRAFGAFVDPAAPMETRLGNAVVKLARHARELARLGFDLPGFKRLLDEKSEVGANVKHWRSVLQEVQRNHERWFADESGADDYATELLQQILDRTAAADPARADRLLICVVNALFAAALYHWQRDLAVFLGKLELPALSSAQSLIVRMMQQRESYIHAAELFGDVHRSTLLRATLAINGWLHARGVQRDRLGQPLRRMEGARELPALGAEAAGQCWQREVLLRIHMDTAIKLANVGAGTGWMLDADAARGTPQLFMMQFESIRQSVNRLRKLMH
jgi:hypothetical protein